ncbi:thioesterase family protein [Paramicrobacterium fandaimingii]|uniref:thioesterase family protein n=1 Tax=Paramicrobacterium fandaimingii TaxID=2708079 RepID=UPI0014211582|nr:thioesterase family protein [Microbacterium fandaimingii]
MSEPYYRDLGDERFESTIHAQGAWNEHEQHMAPASGLLTEVIDREFATEGMRIARLSFEIYGIIHAGEFEVRTQVLRPGRTIELVQAEMICGDRVAISARAWLLATSDTSDLAGIEDAPLQPLRDAERWDGMSPWPGGYIESLEFRTLGEPRPGSRQTWLRSQHPLVDSGDVSPLAHLVRLADTANGLSAREHPAKLLYPNVDLQIHVHRLPRGDWLGIDGVQQYGPDGVGLTSSILNDETGPFARVEQILTLRRR